MSRAFQDGRTKSQSRGSRRVGGPPVGGRKRPGEGEVLGATLSQRDRLGIRGPRGDWRDLRGGGIDHGDPDERTERSLRERVDRPLALHEDDKLDPAVRESRGDRWRRRPSRAARWALLTLPVCLPAENLRSGVRPFLPAGGIREFNEWGYEDMDRASDPARRAGGARQAMIEELRISPFGRLFGSPGRTSQRRRVLGAEGLFLLLLEHGGAEKLLGDERWDER